MMGDEEVGRGGAPTPVTAVLILFICACSSPQSCVHWFKVAGLLHQYTCALVWCLIHVHVGFLCYHTSQEESAHGNATLLEEFFLGWKVMMYSFQGHCPSIATQFVHCIFHRLPFKGCWIQCTCEFLTIDVNGTLLYYGKSASFATPWFIALMMYYALYGWVPMQALTTLA